MLTERKSILGTPFGSKDNMTGHTLKNKKGFTTRDRQQDDFVAFLEIDTHSPEYMWTSSDFKEVLGETWVNAFVVTNFGRVAGYLIYELGNTHIYILNLSVHPDYQGTGVGSMLLDHLKRAELKGDRTQIQCDVRESNLVAQKFLAKNGFKATKVVRDYFVDIYCEGEEDEYEEVESAFTFKLNV